MLRSLQLGLKVAKPYGDSSKYDVLVDSGSHIWRVQVRSTASPYRGRTHFVINTRCGVDYLERYTADQIHFLAALIIPEDAWYIVPIAEFQGMTKFSLFPRHRTGRFEPFREAWHLLNEKHLAA